MPQIALLTNPTSGKGRAARLREAVTQRLRYAGLSVIDLVGDDAEHSLELARSLVGTVDGVVACGGDGFVHQMVQAVAGTETALGIIPAGTGNDIARSLDIPLDPLAAADVVIRGRRRRIDLGRTGDRWFAAVLSAGFDALVNERANEMSWPRGQARYTLATIASLPTLAPRRYLLEIDGATQTVDAVLVAVGNGPSFGGGLRITDGAVLDDGLLDVAVVGPMSRGDLLRTFPKLRTGEHTRHPAFWSVRASTVTIASAGIVAYADGERVAPLPLTVSVVPGALEVFG
ncbi:diacylglycerol/lipid kinase family protein [Nocardioides limicola]|uniref:diacylglycerol/lipid kinase family protein n=1 Tax=Nocardioides limicola TaxID=2803368 RepID=UPI00193B7AC4|nr:YegS/Rv2252/BmrU family lipid kinase [Nocardioides sp. DJM-14]